MGTRIRYVSPQLRLKGWFDSDSPFMTKSAVFLLGDLLFGMTATTAGMKSRFFAAGTAVIAVTIDTGAIPDPEMVTGLAITDDFLMQVMGEVNGRHLRTAEP